jgi:hypothetical protein
MSSYSTKGFPQSQNFTDPEFELRIIALLARTSTIKERRLLGQM